MDNFAAQLSHNITIALRAYNLALHGELVIIHINQGATWLSFMTCLITLAVRNVTFRKKKSASIAHNASNDCSLLSSRLTSEADV